MNALFLTLVLISTFLWASAVVTDKWLVSSTISSPVILTTASSILGFVFALPLLLTGDVLLTGNLKISVILIFTGVGYMVATVLYFRAMNIEDASVISIILKMSPLFVIILAAIFLGESFNLQKYIGMFLLVAVSFVISLDDFRNLSFSEGAVIMLASTIIYASTSIVGKYSVDITNPFNVYFWLRSGYLIAGLLVLTRVSHRSNLKKILFSNRKSDIKFILIGESFDTVAYLIWVVAISLGPVSIASSVSAIQPIFVLGIVYVLYRIGFVTLSDSLERNDILYKLSFSAIAVVGIYLLL